MGTILVNGGIPLKGEITVSGSKNAALPIIFATLITRGQSILHSVPDIGDVDVALKIIEGLGARVERQGSDVFIDTVSLSYRKPSDALVSKIRASTYLIGSLLSRFGIAELQPFGGCNFCTRPIDLHIMACRTLGANLLGDKIITHGLRGALLRLPKVSVGATVNALLLSASAEGVSRIENYAREPHIMGLVAFLRSAGADITVADDAMIVRGKSLHGGETFIDGDPIEAGTYAALSALSGGEITVRGISSEAIDAFLGSFTSGGALLDTAGGIALKSPPKMAVNIVAEPYPGFPTDLQSIAAPLLALGAGGTIEDRVWQGRFGYLAALAPFGIQYKAYPTGAEIFPSRIHSATTDAPDLRGGAAALILALAARGESRITSSEIIARGYENIEKKLSAVGAEIKITD